MMTAEASAFLLRWKILTAPIVFVGKYSLYMLCVHTMDYLWNPFWQISQSGVVNVMAEVGTDCLVFAAVMLIKKYIFAWREPR